MKEKIHPDYQEVLFVDTSTDTKFICGTTLKPKEKERFEGKEYPVYRVAISSASHPFFTGSKQFIDTEGRVDKFRKKYAKAAQAAVDAKQDLEQKKEEKKKALSKKKTTKAKS